ncbi:MAG: glycosyl hydrolase [Verrucomicrobiae bacterium]|nr:glycosyl hydrolase [Verrucomicrobiae bacterium]
MTLIAFTWAARSATLESGFKDPPQQARLWAYWWWLNGNVTEAAITRDLEEMKSLGFGGAVIMDAGGADQRGNARVPAGPVFGSVAWRKLFKHALAEAGRLGLELSLNIQSGWNLGGPSVAPEDAVKKLTWAELVICGPTNAEIQLPLPPTNDGFYRDVCLLAWRVRPELPLNRSPLRNYEVKALLKQPTFPGPHGWFLANSAPNTAPILLEELPEQPGEHDASVSEVIDLTAFMGSDGTLRWVVPEGEWQLVRFGYTLGDWRHVSTSSDGWKGYALDVLDAGAFERYWNAVVIPLLNDAAQSGSNTLRYLHTDSWEIEVFNWTPCLPEEFRKRRGYELKPWLPVLAGRIINSRHESHRFLEDFRRTLGDLAADNHYRLFKRLAAERGLGIHPESGGPHFTPIDAQQCLGINDIPMGEFWARSHMHRTIDEVRFFVKQPASAAHTTGKRIVAAEGFTTIGMHWQETIWDNLKPSFDQALCEGMNRLVWHAVVCSPDEMGVPGQQYFAGTHFNPHTTWWPKSRPFLDYINRCQFMLQQGLFVADVCYYYGDHVPNFAQLKRSDPAKVLPGYDYDVISAEALIERMSVKDGRLVLPDGMSYRLLVLPAHERINLGVLRKIKELVAAGATVLGSRPAGASGLENYPSADAEVRAIANELWAGVDGRTKCENRYRQGRVVHGKTARELLIADGVGPDFECIEPAAAPIDYIHRRDGATDIYFVANLSSNYINTVCAFRVTGRVPEIWLPDTGEIRACARFDLHDQRTVVPLQFAPYGSVFVVFRKPAHTRGVTVRRNGNIVFCAPVAFDFSNAVELCHRGSGVTIQTCLPGLYTLEDERGRNVSLTIGPLPEPIKLTNGWVLLAPTDPRGQGKPRPIKLPRLKSWTEFDDSNLKYFSGTLEYTLQLELRRELFGANRRLWLDLGEVRELAEVELNGKNLGILWKPPFSVDITDAAKPGENKLVVRVTNFWPNRIIGDQFQPPERRVTRTNIRRLTRDTPLMPSGLLGPVRLFVTATGAVVH